MNLEAIAKDQVDAWFAQWTILQETIHAAHDARDGTAQAFMEEAIGLFEQFVQVAGNEVLPINGVERLAFIKAKPGQYACYRQLDELFKETKKRTARLRLQATKG
ncbi:YpoC family protein [Lysinibacillus sp. FSL H8-0500]|uniref:YpoC family protein n=1 Tax=Lysinibacillus sp. FSL H8-0500 TaxID=2921393 RepID=UPI0031015E16